MEYIGKKTRKIDEKTRLVLPIQWREKNTSLVLVKETEWTLCPQAFWKKKMQKLKNDTEKVTLAEKSYQTKIDDSGRVQLPKEFTWKSIELIGVIDYIIIKESTA